MEGYIVRVQPKKRTKSLLDENVQKVQPCFYLPNRKGLSTKEDFDKLTEGTDFEVVGDPVCAFEGNYKYFLVKCKKCNFLRNAGITYLKKKTVSCPMCLRIKLAQEAKEIGLELLGDATDGANRKRSYRFSTCGHIRDISTGDVREKSVSCVECRIERYKKDIDNCGFYYDGEDSDLSKGQSVYVRYKSCNHSRRVFKAHLTDNSVGECEICYSEKLQKEYGDKWGFDIIEEKPGTKRLIRFKDCKHEKIVMLSNMKAGSVSCQICMIEKWKREAEEAELEYIGRENGRYMRYKANCGHEIVSKPAHVRVGHWTCRTCDAGWTMKPSYLYIFEVKAKDGFCFIKLGYSLKPEYRKFDYIMDEGCHCDLLKKVKVSTGLDAMRIENALHDKYRAFNYPSELIKNYLKESGFSECYPLELKDKLLEELEKLSCDKN